MTKQEIDKKYYEKNKEKRIRNVKEWREKNRDKLNAVHRLQQKIYRKRTKKIYPLHRRLDWIKERCNNPKRNNYKNYGAKGIECLLSIADLRYLWDRDKAEFMIRPTIHRLDSDDDYILSNCIFIDWKDHCKISKRNVALKQH